MLVLLCVYLFAGMWMVSILTADVHKGDAFDLADFRYFAGFTPEISRRAVHLIIMKCCEWRAYVFVLLLNEAGQWKRVMAHVCYRSHS